MKSFVLFAVLLIPSFGFGATLTGNVMNSSASVNLANVGTLDWARWPGYTHKANYISSVTKTGDFATYTNDPRIIGDRSGIRVKGSGASFEFTVAATTQERTLLYYFGGWNSNARLTVSLPNATTYTFTTGGASTYSRVAMIKFKANTNTTLTVRLVQTSTTGTIRMQAAALQGARSAYLTWAAPTLNADGTPLNNLAAFKVYWGTTQGTYSNSFRINNPSARSYAVGGLTSGRRYYFVVTAINSAGQESSFSNVASKLIP